MAKTCRKAINEVFAGDDQVLSTRDVIDRINRRHPAHPWKDTTIRAHLIGMSVNHPSADQYYSHKYAFLKWLGEGRFRRWDPAKDGDSSGLRTEARRQASAGERPRHDIAPPTFLPMPTPEEITEAHEVFEARETRQRFYDEAREKVELALASGSLRDLSGALLVLLKTWNKSFYRFRPFTPQHQLDIEKLLDQNKNMILSFRARSIGGFGPEDESLVSPLFTDFECVLGPVGAAKSLHLLAPRFFAVWDRKVAKHYHLRLRRIGQNAGRYCQFMIITQGQCQALGADWHLRNPLKMLDKYNYCKYSRQWM